MRKPGFTIIFLLLMVAQILLWNFFNFSQYVMLTFLPGMILCLPVRKGTAFAMILAFVAGFAVDFFASGMLGLTSLALVPVGLSRKAIIRLVCGEEVFSRGENITIKRQGMPKIALCILMSTAIFLIVYIWADGAGTRPLWFNLVKFASSLLLGTIVSVFIANLFETES